MSPTQETVSARADTIARAAYGRLLAIIASRSGDLAATEDALSDAFVAALTTWPQRGIPDRPEAWLLTVARNRQTDAHRHNARIELTEEFADMATGTDDTPQIDDRLKLMFVCAHPAIDAALHTPLMLQTVLGVQAVDIARAFLIPPTAMAQRLVRAKRKIRDQRIPFVIPDEDQRPARMSAVREAVYGAYAVDWLDGDGDLSEEAFYLSTVLSDLAPDDPEALGLTALIGFVEARRTARVADGVLVPVAEQDTALWNTALIDRAAHMLTRAAQARTPGRFQLEAAIQSVHADRARTGATDWRALSQLYVGLNRLAPSLGSALGHAAVVMEDAGPPAALAMLDRIEAQHSTAFQPAFALRAECLSRMGHLADAIAAYDKAISLCTHTPSRRWLERKRQALSARAS